MERQGRERRIENGNVPASQVGDEQFAAAQGDVRGAAQELAGRIVAQDFDPTAVYAEHDGVRLVAGD
jgi:hypothetical protein